MAHHTAHLSAVVHIVDGAGTPLRSGVAVYVGAQSESRELPLSRLQRCVTSEYPCDTSQPVPSKLGPVLRGHKPLPESSGPTILVRLHTL